MSKRTLRFEPLAWEDYLYWQKTDTKTTQKINRLLKECARDPFAGMGKPEPLRGNLAGRWSRRIDAEHRLVYVATDTELYIHSCRHHYAK